MSYLEPRCYSGPLPDQATPFSVLLKIKLIGFTLLSLEARHGTTPHEKGMQKRFWLREHGPRMLLPHTRRKPVTFLRDGSSEE